MYTIDWTAVMAVALIALVVVFIRISWTLKEICDAVSSGGAGLAGAGLLRLEPRLGQRR